MKDDKRYDTEVSDTTMMTIAASLFGQKNKILDIRHKKTIYLDEFI
jgi:hypothetical protein